MSVEQKGSFSQDSHQNFVQNKGPVTVQGVGKREGGSSLRRWA